MSIEVNATEQLITVNATDTSIDVNVTSQVVDVNATTSVIEVDASNGPGPQGPQGPAGQGVPVGGTTGQVLAKVSATNYDTTWINAGAGTVTSVNASGSVGISVTGGPITSSGTFVITNTAPDQVVALTGAGTATITGTYPNFTITANDQYTGTVTSVNLTAGTGISVTGGPVTSSGSINVVNTAPDQVVSLTGAGSTTISGTYPNFTITSADQYSGTVTSVNMTVPTGFTISGNPITSAGTLALAMASGYAIPTTASQANWDSAYNDKINSAAVTGTTTKTLTLTQQDGGTITASWSDYDTAPVTSVFGRTGDVIAANGDYNTSQVTENTNLYFTNARARQSISETITGIDYDNTTGVFSQTSGYSIPTNSSQTNWDTAYNDKINSAAVSGTTTKTLTLNQQDGGTVTASWSDIDTGLTSVGVSMPSAFNVANSPLTSNGTISVTGAGSVLQYIDGTGALQTFPTGLPPTGQAGGDLTGTYPNPTVHRVHGIDLQNGTPTADDVWVYGGSPAKWQHQKLHTNQITEDTNLFYTDARARAAISETITGIDYSSTTGVFSITSGYGIPTTASQSNWDAAYNDKINSASVTGTTTKTLTLTQQDGGTVTASWSDYDTAPVTSVFGRTGVVTAQSGDYTTTQVTEGTNLYYTEGRVSANTDVAANTAARHSAVTLGTANGLSLSTQQLSLGLSSGSTTGALSSTDWTTFNSKQAALNGTGFVKISGTTISYDNSTYYLASNPNSYIAKTDLSAVTPLSYSNVTGVFQMTQANSSTSGYLTSTDWTTFNNKQSALTNPVTGTGTTNYVPKFTGTSTIGNSLLVDNGTNLTYNGEEVIINKTGGAFLTLTSGTTDSQYIQFSDTGGAAGALAYNHSSDYMWFKTGGSERMRLTSTGLGIGTSSPAVKLDVNGSGRFNGFDATYYNENILAIGNATYNPKIGLASTSGYRWNARIKDVGGNGEYVIRYEEGSLDALMINRLGNLGLGVTPSAWSIVGPVMQINRASFYGYVNQARVGANGYFDGSSFKYIATDFATEYRQDSGQHFWLTAPSGTAGNAITFTQAMTLDASGNLLVGTTTNSSGFRLNVVSATAPIATFTGSTNGYIDISDGIVNSRIQNSGGLFIGTTNSYDLNLRTNATTRLTINASTGAATFSSSVTAGSFLLTKGSITNDTGYGTGFNVIGSATTYIGSSTGIVGFIASNGEVMRLTSTGLGIGTTSPIRTLHVSGGNGVRVNGYSVRNSVQSSNSGFIQVGGSDNLYGMLDFNAYDSNTIFEVSNTNPHNNAELRLGGGFISFRSGATPAEVMRITSGGSVLVGSTSGAVYDENSGGNVENYWNSQFTAINATTKTLLGGVSSNKSIVGFTGVNSSSKQIITAGIYGIMTSATAGSETGDLAFYTKPSGGGMSSNERMRITSGGLVNINSTQTTYRFYIQDSAANWTSVWENTAASAQGLLIRLTGGSAGLYYGAYDGGAYKFYINGSGVVNSTSTSITAISDITLKENIRDLETGLNEVMKLKPRRFDWKDETKLEKNVAGFIAQELEEVLPDLVYDYKYNDKETKKSIKMGDILPTLVKAIQEQQGKIQELKSEIEQLKNK